MTTRSPHAAAYALTFALGCLLGCCAGAVLRPWVEQWAGLLVWLKEQGNKPQLIYDGHDWWASLFARDGWARKGIDADSPGRALALAALRAYGVEL